LAFGVVAAWLFQVGTIESMQGPIAMAMSGIDLSWLAGFSVAGGIYYALHRSRNSKINNQALLTE
jgi:cytosine/uracil/thiamine/allantoin permease